MSTIVKALVIRQNPTYKNALPSLESIKKYFAVALYGNLQKACEKGSGEVIVAVSYSQSGDNIADCIKYLKAEGAYEFLLVYSAELLEWERNIKEAFRVPIKTVVASLQSGNSRKSEDEQWFAHYAKLYFLSLEVFEVARATELEKKFITDYLGLKLKSLTGDQLKTEMSLYQASFNKIVEAMSNSKDLPTDERSKKLISMRNTPDSSIFWYQFYEIDSKYNFGFRQEVMKDVKVVGGF